MNDTTRPVPDFKAIYWADFTIRRSFRAIFMGLIFAAGIWWMLQPMPNALPTPEPTPEQIFGPWVAVGCVVVSILAAIIFARRYLLVKAIFSHGKTVKGFVEETDIYDTNMRSSSSTINKAPTYAYYTTIRYEVQGYERKVRFKLLHSPSTFGIKQGNDIDLMVLDSAPHQPLIRSVYLGRNAS